MNETTNEYDRQRITKGKQLAEEMSKGLNDFLNSTTRKAFIETMAREHRTLQQSFTGLVLDWLQHLASLEQFDYDGRNEASVKIAKELLKGKDKYDLHLPLI